MRRRPGRHGCERVFGRRIDAGRIEAYFELAQGYFARGIEQRIKESIYLRNLHRDELTASSQVFAGGLLSLLRWWLDRGAKESPRAMDEIFHRMVSRGLQLQRTR